MIQRAALRFFYVSHWVVPWLILTVGLYAVVKFVRGYIDKQIFSDADRKLFSTFRDLMRLQGLTGLIYFLWTGFVTKDFPLYRISHAILMLVAAMILRLASLWKNEDDATRYLNHFYLLLASFLIMLVGISLIPNK